MFFIKFSTVNSRLIWDKTAEFFNIYLSDTKQALDKTKVQVYHLTSLLSPDTGYCGCSRESGLLPMALGDEVVVVVGWQVKTYT